MKTLDKNATRHNNLRDTFYETAVAAGLVPFKEGRFLLPGTDRRPADVLVPHWTGGKDAALDVTIVTPIQGATMPAAANTAGHALEHAYTTPRGVQETGHCLLASVGHIDGILTDLDV